MMNSNRQISTSESELLSLLRRGPKIVLDEISYKIRKDISNIEDILSLCEFSSSLIKTNDILYLHWYERKKSSLDLSDPVLKSLLLFCHAHVCYHLDKDHYAYFYSLLAKSFFRKRQLWVWYLYLKRLDFLIAQRNGWGYLFAHKLLPILKKIPVSDQIPFVHLYLYFFRRFHIHSYLRHVLNILQIQPHLLAQKKISHALLKSFLEEKVSPEIIKDNYDLLFPIIQKYKKIRFLLKKHYPDYVFPKNQHEPFDLKSEIHDFTYFNICVNKVIQQKCINSYRHPNKMKWLEGILNMEEQKTLYESHYLRLKNEIEQTREFLKSFTSWYLPDTPYVTAGGTITYAQEEIGGDFISAEEINDEEFLLFIGDTTGKGLYAALIVATIKAFLKTRALDLEPLSILSELSFLIQNLHIEGLYMASVLLKVKKNQIFLYGAGLPQALLFRANSKTIEKIDLSGLWLGIPFMIPKPYSVHQITLNKDDVLMIYTDGILSYSPESGFQFLENVFSTIMKSHFSKSVGDINMLIREELFPLFSKRKDDDFSYILIKGLRD